MTAKPEPKRLTKVQRSLLACARSIGNTDYPNPLTWPALVRTAGNPDWSNLGQGQPGWQTFIPEALEAIWKHLPSEGQVMVYLVALNASDQCAS